MKNTEDKSKIPETKSKFKMIRDSIHLESLYKKIKIITSIVLLGLLIYILLVNTIFNKQISTEGIKSTLKIINQIPSSEYKLAWLNSNYISDESWSQRQNSSMIN